MELRDLVVTPVLILVVLAAAYLIRPHVTDSVNRKYFFPALIAKMAGAIALGCIYQFYYGGGDTFNFHTLGSRQVWEAFMDSPAVGFKLLFGGKDQVGVYEYSSRILFYHDRPSYFVIQVAALFDLLTFSSYSGTAVLFSVLSFCGAWALFVTFYKKYSGAHLGLAISVLFIPSVVFWGSGILKDTLVLAALSLATYCVDVLFNQGRFKIGLLLLLLLSIYVIFSVKLFLLQAFVPTLLLWVSFQKLTSIRSVAFRMLVFPVVAIFLVVSAYYAVVNISKGDARYSLDRIAQTAKITAYDIGFYTGRDAGSGYSLGELDGTFGSLVTKIPQAINVTLFRPYLWEVKNPLMLLSAVEGTCLLLVVIYIVATARHRVFSLLNDPDILFALIFSLIVAFAVGVTSYNFGTLSRYKIPMLPYFALSIMLLYNKNKERKLVVLT